MALIKEEIIGTIKASEVSEYFFKLIDTFEETSEVVLTKLGNGYRFEVFSLHSDTVDDGTKLATFTLISDRYTKSIYAD